MIGNKGHTAFVRDEYRWVIVVAGIIGLFASLGIGRFSLGMLLPAMGDALDLTYPQMGIIGTLNFCGYLGAVLLCGRLISLMGARLLITLGLLMVGASMSAISYATHLNLIAPLYFLTGIGSAFANISIMALISVWFDPDCRGRAMGMVVIGNGLGIVMSGHLVPYLNEMHHDWRPGWLVLGLLVIAASALCWLLIRNRPALKATPGGKKDSRTAREWGGAVEVPQRRRYRIFIRCAVLYFLFGFTYVIYVTFFVTALVQDRGFSEHDAGILWSWVGLLSLGSGPLFGSLSDRYGRKTGLVIVFTIQAAAYALANSYFPDSFLYLSILCFGIVAWSVPSIMAALVGDYAGPEKTASVFGFVTFVFGIGQIVGPYCAGLLAGHTGGFSSAFLLAAILAAFAGGIALGLPAKGE